MAFVPHREGLRIVSFAAADLARDIHVRQEIHLDAPLAVALARLAAAALYVEAEPARLVPALARFRQHRVDFAYGGEDARVSGGIRARRAPNRGLIDLNYFIDLVDADDRAMRAWLFHRAIEFRSQRAVE